MIFGVLLVCLSYVLGMALATLYVRTYALVGAGYYWLMYSVSAVLSVFALLASSGDEIYAVIAIVCLTFVQLILSVIQRSKARTKVKAYDYVLALTIAVLSIVAVFIFASNEIASQFLFVETLRFTFGGLLLGGVTTAMLLGHWYLVQPGMTRKPIVVLCDVLIGVMVVVTLLWLLDPSMLSVLNGDISDGWGGTLGYMWVGSVVTTFVLLVASKYALREKSYTAVMATTGLLYLAILMANGVELIPRTILS